MLSLFTTASSRRRMRTVTLFVVRLSVSRQRAIRRTAKSQPSERSDVSGWEKNKTGVASRYELFEHLIHVISI